MPTDNLIQRADLNQRLTKALEIKGQKSPILTLDSSVVAVVIADDLTQQSEWLTPTSRKLASTLTIAAVAGQTGVLAITNPAGSGVIAVIERVTCQVSVAAQRVTFGLVTGTVPVAPANLFFRDRRNVGAPECRAFSGTDAVSVIGNPYLNIQASNSISIPWFETEGIVIQPGDSWGIQSSLANADFSPTIWLEEIPIR